MAAVSPCPVLGYAVEADAEVRAEGVTVDAELRPRFRLRSPWGDGEVRLALRGLQQVPNALAAAAAALWCGVGIEAVEEALAEVPGPPLRMEVHRSETGPVLVVDCYNANPASTEAALRSLAALPTGRKVALLGLMAELGPETGAEHRRLRLLAERLGIEVVGYQTDLYGGPRVDDADAAVALLRELGPGDAALVKGSRVARLEEVARAYGEAAGVQSLVSAASTAGTSMRRRSSP
jgi:UDP-N-acetylmuramoyl-tripeptide--D-alanyl-D-alanine ligase